MPKTEVVTVECPLCHKIVEIPEYNLVTRSDALVGHIASEHVSRIRPATPIEGLPLPRGWNIRWPWRR